MRHLLALIKYCELPKWVLSPHGQGDRSKGKAHNCGVAALACVEGKGRLTPMSQATTGQGKARTVTNKQPTTEQQPVQAFINMREKSAARRVFVRPLLGEFNWSCQMCAVLMMRIIARRNSEATLHSPFGVAAGLAEMGVLLSPILAPQDATLETRAHSHGNLLVPRYPPT